MPAAYQGVAMFTKRKIFSLILLIFLLILFPSGGCSQASHGNPEAIEGVLNLTQAQLEEGFVNLDGQWEFYWHELLYPLELSKANIKSDDFINVPGSWNGHILNEEKLTGKGYATYRLTINADENGKLSLKIPRIFTSYKLWANKELIASAGTLGDSRDAMTPQYLPQVAFFEAQQGENEILIQVSNFYHRS